MEYLNGKIKLYVTAVPNSKETKIKEISENEIKINIDEPPEKDKANYKLIKHLSKVLKISKSNVKLISGQSSRNKIIVIDLNLKESDDILKMLMNDI